MSAPKINSVMLVRNIPSGAPSLDDFVIKTVDAPAAESLAPNQVLVKTLYLSCDPYMRDRLTGTTESYIEGLKPGKPIEGLGIGIVEASTSDGFVKGDMVTGIVFMWQSHFIAPAEGLTKIPAGMGVPPASYLGVLGVPAFTAYVGLVTLCKPKAGETLLVSSAAGAVGQIVVQLAKARGLRVVASAGSDEKVEFVKSLGVDFAFNYKTCGSVYEAIKKAAPEGIDIYFDNVGGEFLDETLRNLRPYSRIAACGMISQYNATAETAYRAKNLINIIVNRVTVFGFIITDHFTKPEYMEFIQEITGALKEGKIQYKIDEVNGLENAPRALLDLLEGKNFGKSLVKIADL